MSYDPLTVTRSVRDLTHDGAPAKAVVAARIYDTDPADLWDALTNPERLPRWFLPVSGDLRLGGHYQFEGNAGGTITACEPERRIAVTWEYGGGVSWVTVTLAPDPAGGTVLELTHVARLDTIGDFWTQFGPGATGVGWDLGFMGLALHLARPELERPPEADPAWATSPEALDLYRRFSTDWAEADIANGEDAAQARAAAERTRQFYSGETPGGTPAGEA